MRPEIMFPMELLIIDDHQMWREAVAAVMRREFGPETTVLQARDSEQALRIAEDHLNLSAVLLDLTLANRADGMPAIQAFHNHRPGLPVIVLSASEDPKDLRRALDLKARGYLPKSVSPEVLCSAVRFVLQGNVYVPPELFEWMDGTNNELGGNRGTEPRERLSPTQRIVLQHLCNGLPNKEIGRKLGIEEKTVKQHVTAIFKELRVANRTQAVIVAQKRGLASRPNP
jgi:two-component system, NarL family, nitrate/nitrite response regulator NarL